MSIGKELVDIIRSSDDKKTRGYDTEAVVVRVEDDVAWVHIPGGVDETPARRTVNAKPGDKVQVRVADGNAFLVGNASAPPTDDTRANKSYELAAQAGDAAIKAYNSAARAESEAERAKEAADTAETKAAEAKEITDEINDYAETAGKTVTQILHDGETAGAAAQEAKQQATAATTYANSALVQLSVIEIAPVYAVLSDVGVLPSSV